MTEEASPQMIYWALIGRRGDDTATVVVRGARGWQQQFETDLCGVRSDRVVVAVENPVMRMLVDVVRKRGAGISSPIRMSAVKRVIEETGWAIDNAYRIWPTLDRPRVAIPRYNTTLAAWMQRSGVLGGGRAILIRAALRSCAMTPLMLRSSRATAFVLSRRVQEAPAR